MGNGIKLDGDIRKFQRAIRNLSDTDKGRLNKVIGIDLRRSTVERFKTQTDPEGKRWEQSRSATDDGRKVLTDTSRLKNSIKYSANKKSVAVGTNTIYATTHQFGAKNRVIRAKGNKKLKFKVNGSWASKGSVKVTIPARPFMGISEDDMRNIKNTVNSFITDTIES